MKAFECTSIAEAHAKMVQYIYWNHITTVSESGQDLWQSEPMAVTILKPLVDMIHPKSSAQKQKCESYVDQLLNGTEADFDYTYHDRLYDYFEVNQIDECIEHIRKFPETRRAIAITWKPEIDPFNKNVPCLQFIQFSVSDQKLNMYVLFRSQDILGAFGSNAYGLAMLQKLVATRTLYEVGKYEHIVTFPHLYPKTNDQELKRMIEC